MNDSHAPSLPAPETPAEPREAAGAPPLPLLTPSEPMILLGYRCLQRELGAIVARQPPRDTAPRSEEVHQMRVATRRARVALRLFGYMLPRSQAKRLRHELRWFARALGSVRDLDVHAQSFRDYLRSVPGEQAQALGDYELHLRRDRAAARHELTALFQSERYAAFIAEFTALVDSAPSAGALRRWRSFRISDGAAQYLRKSKKRVRKLGRKLDADASAKDLHRLRIRAKRLRYEMEFFLEVYPGLARAAKATKQLQDLLGAHQDTCVATERMATYLRALRGRHGGQTVPRPALDHWEAYERQQGLEARRAFPVEWQRLVRELKNTSLDSD